MARYVEKISAVSTGMMTKATSKQHVLSIDEPPQMGGQDQGPNPLGTLLSALAGCENVIANMVAKEIGFDLQGIEFDIEGELDLRGLKGEPNVRPYFQKVIVNAKVKTSEPEERIRQLQKITDSRCPVFTMMKAAGVEMVVNWTKA